MENSKNFSIKQWSDDDRPREKLLLKGKSILSDAELIAILIGSGSRNESAVDLSKRILNSVEHLNALGKLSVKQLMVFKGIGEAKAITIIAALELGRRRGQEEQVPQSKISSSKAAFEILKPLISELPHEEFWVLYLSNSNNVIYKSQLSKGGMTGTVVDTRLLFKTALEHHAVAVILAHNHPSGNIRPSDQDKQITKKIKEAGAILDVNVLDHIIVSEFEYFSFADEGLM